MSFYFILFYFLCKPYLNGQMLLGTYCVRDPAVILMSSLNRCDRLKVTGGYVHAASPTLHNAGRRMLGIVLFVFLCVCVYLKFCFWLMECHIK